MSIRHPCLVGFLLSVSWAIGSVIEQGEPRFQVSTTLVRLDVEVRDSAGRFLPGLHQGDFELFKNGTPQDIAFVVSDEQPLDLLFLLDVSSSMKSCMKDLADGCRSGLQLLRIGDRVGIMTFNSDIQRQLSFTQDLSIVQGEMNRISQEAFRGGTLIQPAIIRAARYVRENRSRDLRRRAILIITDNLSRSTHQEHSAINEMREADASLNGLVVQNRRSIAGLLAASGARLPGGIEHIVESTGGTQVAFRDAARDLPLAISRIRSSYSVYYRLPEGMVDKNVREQIELSAAAKAEHPDYQAAVLQVYPVYSEKRELLLNR